MVAKKPKSKRETCKHKYKVKRKITEANRKARKEAKKQPRRTKDPGIPNSLPDKGEMLKLAERQYKKELYRVIESSDVVLQVLDARDPQGTRCGQLEQNLRGMLNSPKLVFVLNKIDLVPRENLVAWMQILKQEAPTIAFKANTQSQRTNLGQKGNLETCTDKQLKSSECVGAEDLMNLLKNYARSNGMKKVISVGVVGFPNVGKSSLINSMRRSKVCAVGATPGVTKTVQEIHLDKHVRLIDSPGVVSPLSQGTLLLNCLRVECIEDPILPVSQILERIPKSQMMVTYNVLNYNCAEEFLGYVGRARGKLKKGGVPDLDAAARLVLNDWNRGLISFCTEPPKIQNGEKQVVSELAPAFLIE